MADRILDEAVEGGGHAEGGTHDQQQALPSGEAYALSWASVTMIKIGQCTRYHP